MANRLKNLKVVVVWKAKRRFQWRLVDRVIVVAQGEEATVILARATAAVALNEAYRFV